jgi:nucleotide-binding universal stress UspA family protein
VTSEVGTANEVAMEILRIGEHNNADLIVIATHGMTGWHKLAFGSVAEKVVRLAECRVLVLRAQPQASASETVASHSVAASR